LHAHFLDRLSDGRRQERKEAGDESEPDDTARHCFAKPPGPNSGEHELFHLPAPFTTVAANGKGHFALALSPGNNPAFPRCRRLARVIIDDAVCEDWRPSGSRLRFQLQEIAHGKSESS
jgi:hypothetical protein